MFINCPHCNALVATDPATDLPPARCPRCASVLRETQAEREAAATRSEAFVDDTPDSGGGIGSAASRETDPHDNDEADDVSVPGKGGESGISMIQVETPSPAGPAATETEVATSAQQIERTPAASATETEDSAQSSIEDAPQALQETADTTTPDSHDTSAGIDRADTSADTDIASGVEGHVAAAEVVLADEPSSTTAPTPITASRRDKPAPSFVRARAPMVAANARRRWALPSLIAGLSLLLAVQWILADRARLAADADWRPFVAQLCATLRCGVPPWHEPSAFALLERDVRPHPTVQGALRVTATFRNDARWPQPWPEVVLTLSDVDGRTIGARAFDAIEYLGTAPTQNALSSGQTAAIRMDLVEPSPRSVAFAFDFR